MRTQSNSRRFPAALWAAIQSVPIWVKIMGIVAVPALLGVFATFTYFRRELLATLSQYLPPDALEQFLRHYTGNVSVAFALLLFLCLSLAFVMSRVLTRPIARLLRVIRTVERDDFSARVEVSSGDEIGRVQAAFNQMLDQLVVSRGALERRNRELAGLNALAEAISLGQQQAEILERALGDARELIGAELGSLYFLGPDRLTLSLQAIQGEFSPAFRSRTVLRVLAETPMRRVVESGEGLLMEDVSKAEEFPAEMARLFAADGFRGWICAPLRTRTGVIGVVNLLRKREASFTIADLKTLEAVAYVLGVGLANTALLGELQQKDEEMRRAFARAVQYQEEERRRLSRELHDEIGQALTSILIRLKTLQEEPDPAGLVDRLDGIRYLTSQAIEDLRRLAMDLRPAALDNLGIIPALRGHVQQSAKQTGRTIRFLAPEKMRRLPGEIELVLYRVAQECLNNAIRHSDAGQIDIVLEIMPRAVWLSVNDNGRGFDPNEEARGLGLVGVRERVELLNGTYRLQSSPGAGTSVWIEIPLPEEEPAHAG